MRDSNHRLVVAALCLGLSMVAVGARGEEEPEVAEDLAELSLEDLMNLEITSVSRRAEKLSDSPAAVYVITNEDLRRSGVTTIPEALRMVPGVQVAQISANRWAISARGFNDTFANKLLVLMDGRSVYTPLFSGVFWDVQDTMIEDIDRIEVIRGPGAALWGANAVNGVINIITKRAEDTQGGLVTAGAGTHETGFTSLRYGGRIGDEAHYRGYAKYFARDSFDAPEGGGADDDWQVARGGYRVDWDLGGSDSLTFQGDYYDGEAGERHFVVESLVPASRPVRDEDVPIRGFNTMARWTHTFSETSSSTFQFYWDQTERDIGFAEERRNTVDLDFTHGFELPFGQDLLWGLGYRRTWDNTRGSQSLHFDPSKREDDLFTAFVQDEISFFEDRFSLTLGTKIERNDYTGFEIQPSARALWRPFQHHTLWTAVSKAARTPSRAGATVDLIQEVTNESVTVPVPFPPFSATVPYTMVQGLTGNEDLDSEKLLAYEFGYRFTPAPRFSLDLALFYNDYEDLRSNELVTLDSSALEAALPTLTPPSVPGVVAIAQFENQFDGRSYGGELASHFDVTPWWRLSASYSFIRLDLQATNSLDPTTEEQTEGTTPRNQFNFRSNMDLPWGFELDTALYYVDDLPAQDVSDYVRVDVRLGWSPREDLRLSLVGQNLQSSNHQEFGDAFFWVPSQVERSFYGRVEWSF